jgi:hypothetical protein
VTFNRNRIERSALNALHAILNNCLEIIFVYYEYKPIVSQSNTLFFCIINYRNTINTKRFTSRLYKEQFELKNTKLQFILIYVKYTTYRADSNQCYTILSKILYISVIQIKAKNVPVLNDRSKCIRGY